MSDFSKVPALLYPSEMVADWFGVSLNDLLHLEESGEIPKSETGPKGEKIYRRHHVGQIAEKLRSRLRQEMKEWSQSHPDEPYPPEEFLERLYRIEFFGSEDPGHGLDQLEGLAREKGLTKETTDNLIRDALSRPRADSIRLQLLKVLLADSDPEL